MPAMKPLTLLETFLVQLFGPLTLFFRQDRVDLDGHAVPHEGKLLGLCGYLPSRIQHLWILGCRIVNHTAQLPPGLAHGPLELSQIARVVTMENLAKLRALLVVQVQLVRHASHLPTASVGPPSPPAGTWAGLGQNPEAAGHERDDPRDHRDLEPSFHFTPPTILSVLIL
jgi:hypothetical protein